MDYSENGEIGKKFISVESSVAQSDLISKQTVTCINNSFSQGLSQIKSQSKVNDAISLHVKNAHLFHFCDAKTMKKLQKDKIAHFHEKTRLFKSLKIPVENQKYQKILEKT